MDLSFAQVFVALPQTRRRLHVFLYALLLETGQRHMPATWERPAVPESTPDLVTTPLESRVLSTIPVYATYANEYNQSPADAAIHWQSWLRQQDNGTLEALVSDVARVMPPAPWQLVDTLFPNLASGHAYLQRIQERLMDL